MLISSNAARYYVNFPALFRFVWFFDCQCHMLLLLWCCRSTLLTCHVAVVFGFCSSLQQWLPGTLSVVVVGLWTELGIVASQTSSHNQQWWFIMFQMFCLSLPILFDSIFIFSMYFSTEGSFCRKEHSTVYESPCFSFLFYAWEVCMCPLNFKFTFFLSGIQFSHVSDLCASLVNWCGSGHRWAFTDFFLQW